jgi:outer membrane protein assembly factor BamB
LLPGLTGELDFGAKEVLEWITSRRIGKRPDRDLWTKLFGAQALVDGAWVTGSPVLTEDHVIARSVADGSVMAFDRDLQYLAWNHEFEEPRLCAVSGLLVDDRYVAPLGGRVVALSAVNGKVEWTFDTGDDGDVEMVPASDGDLVYFGTTKGIVFAVELGRGRKVWRQETNQLLLGNYPVVFGDRVVFASEETVGQLGWSQGGQVRALRSYDGEPLWKRMYVSVRGAPGFYSGDLLVVGHGTWQYLYRPGDGRQSSGTTERDAGGGRFSGVPLLVGYGLYVLEDWDLIVVDTESKPFVRWRFDPGGREAVLDFVHAGNRIYAVTTAGLVCIADEPGKPAVEPGYSFGPGSEKTKKPLWQAQRR